MTSKPRGAGPDDTQDAGSTGDRPPPVPRWVWISAIVLGALIAVAIAMMLISGGEHGPGRHLSIGPGLAPVATVTLAGTGG